MKVAIIHYWLVGMRGGEKVLENLCKIYPQADIFTHVLDRDKISNKIKSHTINTTFINKLPFAKKIYKYYFPLMPLALKKIKLKSYDLIISSESGPAKGIIKNKRAFHLCYCHTPMRYIWDMQNDYLENLNNVEKFFLKIFIKKMKKWDIESAKNIDKIISNSTFVSKRIKKYWNRNSTVVHPSINFEEFKISREEKSYYLIISYFVPYKKIDIAIKAFNKLNKKLIIIGDGPMFKKLKKISHKNIKFLGWKDGSIKSDYLSNCKALIFPGIEDFGITPLESIASGRPVIAYNKGGVLDYLENNFNSILFNEQSPDSIIDAVNIFEKKEKLFSSSQIREKIKSFNNYSFRKKIKNIIDMELDRNEYSDN